MTVMRDSSTLALLTKDGHLCTDCCGKDDACEISGKDIRIVVSGVTLNNEEQDCCGDPCVPADVLDDPNGEITLIEITPGIFWYAERGDWWYGIDCASNSFTICSIGSPITCFKTHELGLYQVHTNEYDYDDLGSGSCGENPLYAKVVGHGGTVVIHEA